MTSAVASDPLYTTLAGSPMTETYATSRAHEIMEELIGKERDRELKRRVEHLAGGGAGGGGGRLIRLNTRFIRSTLRRP